MPPHYYERIRELNAKLHAFITVLPEAAPSVPSGPLAGCAVGVKDIIDTAGVLTSAGSALFKDRVPAVDAEVVARVKRAGATIIGKTNTHEFAFGPTGAVSHYGPSRNPFNQELITGGSSGGSAAAVATGMCDMALGTDTGGSIRIPAAYCGVVGFKPTYGKAPTSGVIPLSTTFDHVGPIARNVSDVTKLYEVLSGESIAQRDVSNLRVGVVRDYFFSELDTEIAFAVENAITECRAAGWKVQNATLPCQPDFPLYRTVTGYEVYQLHKDWLTQSPDSYQPLTSDRLKSAASITTGQYLNAMQQVKEQRERIAVAFADYDLLLTPTVSIQAPTVEAALLDGFAILLRNTSPFNVWGIPAISLPCGKTRLGIPIGVQLAAAQNQDSLLLSAASVLGSRLRVA